MDRAKLHSIYRYLIDWLFPNICPVCEKCIDYDADFCDDCKSKLILYKGDSKVAETDGFTAYCLYKGDIKKAILHFKYDPNGNSYYAFAKGIEAAVKRDLPYSETELIIPIPSSKKTLKTRGYNQVELIAKELRFMLGVPYANVLEKVKETKVQKSLYMHERAENVAGAFALSPKAPDISGKTVLLIDDVCTTGSTLSEAAKALKKAGAAKVYAAAFAKTPFKDDRG